MTILIAGSIVLILGSAATLVLGWTDQNESLIWTSIVLSLGAAVALTLAYVRSKRELARSAAPPAPGAEIPSWGVGAVSAAPSGSAAPLPAPSETEPPAGAAEEPPVAEAPPPAGDLQDAPASPASETSTEELSASDVAAAPSRAAGRSVSKPKQKSPSQQVIAIPVRKKFHRPECRYAKSAGGERITKAQARRRSYDACGICKP